MADAVCAQCGHAPTPLYVVDHDSIAYFCNWSCLILWATRSENANL